MAELVRRVTELRERIDQCIGRVTGRRSMLFMRAQGIGYPDVGQLNPCGDLTLALITNDPEALLKAYPKETNFLMNITDEQVQAYGGKPEGQWQLIRRRDEERKNPYGRDGYFRTYKFSLG